MKPLSAARSASGRPPGAVTARCEWDALTWGPDLSGSLEGAGGVGGLLMMEEKPGSTTGVPVGTYYPLYDGNGNITQLLDAAGSVATHYDYDAFGNVTAATGPAAAHNPWRFSTKPQDPVSGFHYYGYRHYDPVTGRWPSRDPIGEEGGVNLFGMCYNELTNIYDVLGANPLLTTAPVTSAAQATSNAAMSGLVAEGEVLLQAAVRARYVRVAGGAGAVAFGVGLGVGATAAVTSDEYEQLKNDTDRYSKEIERVNREIERLRKKRAKCKELYDEYKYDKGPEYTKKPASAARTCGELKDAMDRFEVYLRVRKEYMENGCDEFDWDDIGNTAAERSAVHGRHIKQERSALDRMEKLWRDQCICPDGTLRPGGTLLKR